MSVRTFRKIMWVIGIINIVCLLYMEFVCSQLWNTLIVNPIFNGILRGLATLPFFYLMFSTPLVIGETVLTIIMIILQLLKFRKAVKTDFLLFFIASMPLWGHIYIIAMSA